MHLELAHDCEGRQFRERDAPGNETRPDAARTEVDQDLLEDRTIEAEARQQLDNEEWAKSHPKA